MDGLLHYVCDAHTTGDRIGPLITRLDGEWGYCAGNAADGHRWRKIEPVSRQAFEAALQRRVDDEKLGGLTRGDVQ